MSSNCSRNFLKTIEQSTFLNERLLMINEGSDLFHAHNNSKFYLDKNYKPIDRLSIQKQQRRKSTGRIRFISDAPFVEINLNNSFYSKKLNVQDQNDKKFKKKFSKSMNHIDISKFDLKENNFIRKFSLSSNYLIDNTKISQHLNILRKIRSFDDLIIISKKDLNQSNYHDKFSRGNSLIKSHQENDCSYGHALTPDKPLLNFYLNENIIESSSQFPNLDVIKYLNKGKVSLHRSSNSPEILIDQFKNLKRINNQANFQNDASLNKISFLTDQESTFEQNHTNVQIHLENSEQEKSILYENLAFKNFFINFEKTNPKKLNSQKIDFSDLKLFNKEELEQTVNFIFKDSPLNTASQLEDNKSLLNLEINPIKNENFLKNQNSLIKNDLNDSLFGELQIQISHNEKDQQITVKILKARNLIPKDANGYSDPFVKIYLLPGREYILNKILRINLKFWNKLDLFRQENKRRTNHILKNLNPEWNCTVVYHNVYREELKYKTLEFTIWDWDRFKSNDFLGIVKIDLIDPAVLDDEPTWYKIQNPKFIVENTSFDRIKTKETKSRSYSSKRKSSKKK